MHSYCDSAEEMRGGTEGLEREHEGHWKICTGEVYGGGGGVGGGE